MKIKTSELEGAALDWAVAKAVCSRSFGQDWMKGWLSRGSPSTDWSQAGPLIERNISQLLRWQDGDFEASIRNGPHSTLDEQGATPLIAACRAIVAADLGDEVDVPDELVEPK